MKESNKKISDALQIEFVPETILAIIPPILEEPKEKIETPLREDFSTARINIKDLIKTGMTSLEGIVKVATESDSPRAYEVLTNMMKTLSDMNKDLIVIHDKLTDAESKKVTVKNTTNNSIYVGSTTDLQNLINKDRSPLKCLEIEDGS